MIGWRLIAMSSITSREPPSHFGPQVVFHGITLDLQVVFHGIPWCESKKKKKKKLKHPVQSSPFHLEEKPRSREEWLTPDHTGIPGPLTFCIPAWQNLQARHTYLAWLMFNIRARSWTWRFLLGHRKCFSFLKSSSRTLHSSRRSGLREALHSKTLLLFFLCTEGP